MQIFLEALQNKEDFSAMILFTGSFVDGCGTESRVLVSQGDLGWGWGTEMALLVPEVASTKRLTAKLRHVSAARQAIKDVGTTSDLRERSTERSEVGVSDSELNVVGTKKTT